MTSKEDRISRLKSPSDCEQFIENCEQRGEVELAKMARIHLIKLRAQLENPKTEAERDAWEAIHAYEELLTEKHRRRTSAGYTRRMIKDSGVIRAIDGLVSRSSETSGYKLLKEKGHGELAFEVVVLRYPELFSEEAKTRARERVGA